VIKREQDLHESLANENLYESLLNCHYVVKLHEDQMRTRIAREPTGEGLHESSLIFHCLTKREQELHRKCYTRLLMYISLLVQFIGT
jgi:hypothetical protein